MWCISQAFISTGRLSKFLSCTEKSCNIIMESMWQMQGQAPPPSALRRLTNNNTPTAVAFLDACSTWSNNSCVEQMAVLNNMSLEVPKGLLVAVVGEVINYLLTIRPVLFLMCRIIVLELYLWSV